MFGWTKDNSHRTHYLDASAARSIILRRGVGSLKHLEVKDLWAQEAALRERVDVEKVERKYNVADSLASPSNPSDFHRMMADLRLELAGLE